jgi:hypothetical protein
MPLHTHNSQSEAEHVIRDRVGRAVEILGGAIRRRDRSVRATVDVRKIEEEISAYVKNPRTTINRRFFLSPDPPPVRLRGSWRSAS